MLVSELNKLGQRFFAKNGKLFFSFGKASFYCHSLPKEFFIKMFDPEISLISSGQEGESQIKIL
jgi:hypothetical protein